MLYIVNLYNIGVNLENLYKLYIELFCMNANLKNMMLIH